MRGFLGGFSVVMAAALVSSSARGAEPREVLVARTTGNCVDARGLARAIHRDTSLPVRVVGQDAAAERPEQVVVRATGRDQNVTVTIQGAGFDVEQRVQAASCETATDVVAALAVSALAPAPPVALLSAAEAPPPLSNARVEKLIGDALTRRGVSLAELDVRMSIDTNDGRYAVRLSAKGARCAQEGSVDLGVDLKQETISKASTSQVARQIDALVEARKHCLETDEVARKGALLAEDLSPRAWQEQNRRRLAPYSISLDAILAAGWIGLGAATHETNMYLFGAGWSMMTAGSVFGVVGGDYGPAMAEATMTAGVGVMFLSFGLGRRELRWSPYAVGGISGTLFVESAFIAAGAAWRRPVSGETLLDDYHLVGSPAVRDQLTEHEFARIEDDFQRSSSPLPPWLRATPMFVGGSVAIGAAFLDKEPASYNRVFEGLMGGLLLMYGAFEAFPQTGYAHYRKALETNRPQLSWMTFPGSSGGGLLVRGRF